MKVRWLNEYSSNLHTPQHILIYLYFQRNTALIYWVLKTEKRKDLPVAGSVLLSSSSSQKGTIFKMITLCDTWTYMRSKGTVHYLTHQRIFIIIWDDSVRRSCINARRRFVTLLKIAKEDNPCQWRIEIRLAAETNDWRQHVVREGPSAFRETWSPGHNIFLRASWLTLWRECNGEWGNCNSLFWVCGLC